MKICLNSVNFSHNPRNLTKELTEKSKPSFGSSKTPCQISWFCSLYGREGALVSDVIKFKRKIKKAVNTVNWSNTCIHLLLYDIQNSKTLEIYLHLLKDCVN